MHNDWLGQSPAGMEKEGVCHGEGAGSLEKGGSQEEERTLDGEITVKDSQVWRRDKEEWQSTGQQGGCRWFVTVMGRRDNIIGSMQKQIGLGL